MGRSVSFEVPVETSLFTPLQLHPRSVFGIAMSGWARWLREHWVPFPRLIQEQKLGVVIANLDLNYVRPFGFFDADTLLAVVSVTVRRGGRLLFLDMRLMTSSGNDEVATVAAVLRPVKIADGVVFAATPADLDARIFANFADDEIVSPPTSPRVREVVAELETGDEPIAIASRSFTLRRHLCEVADQWSAIALPDLTTDLREQLAVDHEEDPALTSALVFPMRRITMEFRRPAFFLDRFTVDCRAYVRGETTLFSHTFSSLDDGERLATFVERFPTTDSRTHDEFTQHLKEGAMP